MRLEVIEDELKKIVRNTDTENWYCFTVEVLKSKDDKKVLINIVNQYMKRVDCVVENKGIALLIFFWHLQKVLSKNQKFDDELYVYYNNTMNNVTEYTKEYDEVVLQPK